MIDLTSASCVHGKVFSIASSTVAITIMNALVDLVPLRCLTSFRHHCN